MKYQNLADIIDQNFKNELAFLASAVNISSGTGDFEGNRKMLDLIMPVLREISSEISCQADSNGNHLLARIGNHPNRSKLLLCAHMDTVFDRENLSEHLFHTDGDLAYGLGISDDKGGITTILYALKALKEAGTLPAHEILVMLNCDEETGSPTGKKIFKQICCSGNIAAALVFEPTRGRLPGGIITHRGGSGYFTIRITGQEAHSGTSFEKGRNAVVEAAEKAVRLHALNDSEKGIIVNVAAAEGGTYFSDAPVCMVPGSAVLKCNLRVRDESDLEPLLARIREISDTVYIPGCSSEFSCSLPYHAMNLSLNRPLYAAAVKIASALGFEPEEIHTMSGSDANHINQYDIPVIDALGPYTYGIHTAEEHTCISSIRHQTLFAAALIQDLFLRYPQDKKSRTF